MSKKIKIAATAVAAACLLCMVPFSGCSETEDTVTLRVANWEEYIDLGGWDEDEVIDLDGEEIFGENSVVDDFAEWFNSQDYGFKVKVEYSTFGTNEDLYNQLNLGDVYDLVCPSEYMIMKLMKEGKLLKYSDEFKKESVEGNYYTQGVSDYIIESISDIGDYDLTEYAACYMWGTTGLVYNHDEVNEDDVSTWSILTNTDYEKAVTVKDNVRDAYFAALSIHYAEELDAINADSSMTEDEKTEARSQLLNATDDETIAAAEDILKDIKENVYSFETDSGKSDMVTGKVLANFQWSGDAVYIMDEADAAAEESEDGTELWFSVPDESTNLWFDGWVMLKDGIDGNANRQTAAEAFVNFISRPDIAVRNMYYIGYTSSIADEMVFDYFDWCYGVVTDKSDEDYYEFENIYVYDVSYFFGDDSYIYIDMDTISVDGAAVTYAYSNDEYVSGYTVYEGGTISSGRQVFAQYPTTEVIERSVIMQDFGDDLAAINQMWINVRCLDITDISVTIVVVVAIVIAAIVAAICLYRFRYKLFYKKRRKTA
ncbi:MAG: ABC transporter substrate-binding protein [Clostridia bacterium]|nr:ABC transporter substrate-binding protein [Clostridia bacterium]